MPLRSVRTPGYSLPVPVEMSAEQATVCPCPSFHVRDSRRTRGIEVEIVEGFGASWRRTP